MQLPEDIVTLLTSEVEPDDADTYNAHGIAYGENGEFDKAIEAFTKAIKLNSDAANVYSNRGLVYCNQGKFHEAIDDFNIAIISNLTRHLPTFSADCLPQPARF